MLGKINASLNNKLKNVKWGEYKLGDLFDIRNTLSFNTDKLVPGNDYDYVTRTSTNQGILQTTSFINKENINEAGVWSLGLLQMDFFYREREWYAGQFVRKIIPKFPLTKNIILFFTTILNLQKPILLSVLVRKIDETFNNIKIKLPISANNDIDYNFMESLISKLEEERMSELEAYLKASGLDNYELTFEEKELLENYKEIQFEEYSISDFFEVLTPKKKFDANKVNVLGKGKHPYIVRMSTNNGQKGYIDENTIYLNDANTLSFGQDTATVFYQGKQYFTGDKIKILKFKNGNLNSDLGLYFVSAIFKSFSKFSWGASSFSVDVINNQKIKVPVKNKNVDIETMKFLIRLIKKLVIKDIVKYTNKKLNVAQ